MSVKVNERLIMIIVIVILLILNFRSCGLSSDLKEKDNLIESLSDTVVTWKDNYNREHAKIRVIETKSTHDFIKLQVKDSLIVELKEQVKYYKKRLKNQGSITIFETETQFDTIFQIAPSENLTYKAQISNEFIDSEYGFLNDSSFFSLRVHNKYSIIIGQEKEGLFKRKSYVEVINENPYTTIKSLRSYQKLKDNRKFSLGPQLGIGLTNDLQLRPYLGIGLQYPLIKF